VRLGPGKTERDSGPSRAIRWELETGKGERGKGKGERGTVF
jgi:hypothetical protein